jgi:threonine/homoserine/homoserine lactone efflux protein
MTAHREITCAPLRFQIVALLLSFVVAGMFWIGLELTDARANRAGTVNARHRRIAEGFAGGMLTFAAVNMARS